MSAAMRCRSSQPRCAKRRQVRAAATGAALLLAATFAPARGALAAQTCATSASAIQSALTVAASNGQDDVVRIVAGTYPLAAGLTFSSTEAHSLTLSGGWNAGCTLQTFAATILDGQDTVPLLDVTNSNGGIRVEHLTLESGKSTASLGAPVSLASNNQAVIVEFDNFFGNKATAGVGGLSAYAGAGGLRVRDNLFFGNHGALFGAAILSQDSGLGYVTGNTIVANITDTAQTAGGLALGGNGQWVVSNNLLWNNAGANAWDFSALSKHSRFNNDIGVVGTGTAPDQVSGEMYVDPEFAPCSGFLCFSFELAWDSPLVDAGVDVPADGQVAIDLAGKPRLLGAHVDIGAFENEVIFVDGFE